MERIHLLTKVVVDNNEITKEKKPWWKIPERLNLFFLIP
jgi:hypothetical protein